MRWLNSAKNIWSCVNHIVRQGRTKLNPVCQGCTNPVYLVTGAAGFCMVAPNAFCIIIAVSLSLSPSPRPPPTSM